jgi:hypothetical protein
MAVGEWSPNFQNHSPPYPYKENTMAKKKEVLGIDLPGAKLISRYKSKWDGDIITNYKIGSQLVTEVETSEDPNDKVVDDTPTAPKQNRMKKEQRVEMIKDMLAKKKSREEIKKEMYSQDIYKGNPNPASAFAGDWKAAN